MRAAARRLACLAAIAAVEASAAAAPLAPISGTLDKPGYTVIALAGGQATTVLAEQGAFSVVPPAATVTLHLRGPDGLYAGPILPRESGARVAALKRALARAKRAVTAKRRAVSRATKARLPAARRALRRAKAQRARADRRLRAAVKARALRASRAPLGIRAGAQLGTITVDTTRGAAVIGALSPAAWTRSVDGSRTAQALHGVPIGAGNFGLVRSTPTDGAASNDIDLDGIPDALDVDDDGDLVLDDADASAPARAAQAPGSTPFTSLSVFTFLGAFEHGVNVHAGSTEEQIAEAGSTWGMLDLGWTGFDPGAAELDCRGLLFCSLGGTGVLRDAKSIYKVDGREFPECCDADNDGFGTMTHGQSGPMELFHGAAIDQVGTGDVLIARGTAGGVETESPRTIGFAFATTPVFASYDDGQGNSGEISYPRGPCTATGAGAPCPLPVRANPDGDVVLTLTLWRPQRRRLDSEPGSGRWTDMGKLAYMVDGLIPTQADTGHAWSVCGPPNLTEDDTDLEPAPSYYPGMTGAGSLRDLRSDQPLETAGRLTFTVNLGGCVTANGGTFAVGDEILVNVTAFATGPGTLAKSQMWVNFERIA